MGREHRQTTLAVPPQHSAATHEFIGQHLMVSYRGCQADALGDHAQLVAMMRAAVQAAGATLLRTTHYVFPAGGLTAVLLLAESHASIHTYPEYGACFVDLFTCGRACRVERFEQQLRAYLRPRHVDHQLLQRC